MDNQIKKLFELTKINHMKLKNRFMRSATWENLADEKGHMTEKLLKIYQNLAEGQLGLIITGCSYVIKGEKEHPGMMGIYNDCFIEEYKKLTEIVHGYGSKIVLQFGYGGSQTSRKNVKNGIIWGPSAVPEMKTGIIASEMSKKDINKLIKIFGEAALRAKDANFDGVQIHAAHGYLFSQFLNPYHNQRTDKYGGSIKNRARIVFELYDEIRNKVGKSFAVMIKINCRDFVKKEFTLEESKYVCKELAKKGIDAIEISGGIKAANELSSSGRKNIDTLEKEAYFKNYAAEVTQEINIPIILVGGIRSIQTVENILKETEISYFSLCRPLLAEPDLIKRWLIEGDRRKSKCISCNRCRTPGGNFCIYNRE